MPERSSFTDGPSSTRRALEQAHAEAVRTASWLAGMGALGLGVALVMGTIIVPEGSLLAPGFGLEAILFVGGLGGGVVFTVLALRASRMARSYRSQLDGQQRGRR